ncbi:MAG: polysaccharide biosynthesis/export family protein [Bacteroidaceae bacterium]|nr:polysaccharide biosynthesis/export family protein [Bacteroidaceae bacterium]
MHLKKTFSKIVLPAVVIMMLVGSMSSCLSNKEIVYIQGVDTTYAVPRAVEQAYELHVQPDDQLAISVTSRDKTLLAQFNNNTLIGGGNNNATGTNSANIQSGVAYFRVDTNGEIAFPIFGMLKVAGMTTREVSMMIQDLIRNGDGENDAFVKDAIVNTKIMSFKITVLGDVSRPGEQTFTGERLTVLEALGRAGDLNNSAKRNKVYVVREENGTRVAYHIDLRDEQSVFSSPAYYLQQNDVVYVHPNKAVRVKGSTSYTLLSVSSTLVSMVVSIISLIIAINR